MKCFMAQSLTEPSPRAPAHPGPAEVDMDPLRRGARLPFALNRYTRCVAQSLSGELLEDDERYATKHRFRAHAEHLAAQVGSSTAHTAETS
jgi:hypothetical protein